MMNVRITKSMLMGRPVNEELLEEVWSNIILDIQVGQQD